MTRKNITNTSAWPRKKGVAYLWRMITIQIWILQNFNAYKIWTFNKRKHNSDMNNFAILPLSKIWKTYKYHLSLNFNRPQFKQLLNVGIFKFEFFIPRYLQIWQKTIWWRIPLGSFCKKKLEDGKLSVNNHRGNIKYTKMQKN